MLLIRVLSRRFSGMHKPVNKIPWKREELDFLLLNSSEGIDWKKVREKMIDSERFLNNSNVDAVLIGRCSQHMRLDLAKSYIDFLKSSSMTLNDATIGRFLQLFYNHYRRDQNNACISSEDEEQILKYSNFLISKHEMVGSSLAEKVVEALSLTREWKKCVELLSHVKITDTPSKSTYCSIILKALDENNLDIAWSLMNEMFRNQTVPSTAVITKYFEIFQQNYKMVEKMLTVISENNVLLHEGDIENYIKVLSIGRDCKIVNIDRNGECPACNSRLHNEKLNDTEFKKLSDTFLKNVMIRKDAFIKTSPAELKRFMNFVDSVIPVSCVIDGLNVAYSHGVQKNANMYVNNIASSVKYFVERNMTTLVIGRKHMARWPKHKMDYIRRNSSLFLAENLTQDDPFILYAALKSGPQTKIFTRDLMRGHSFLLDTESKILFRRWQIQNQFSLITTLKNEILVQEPISFDLRAHKVNSFWHIPFTSENLSFTYESFELPSRWLCVSSSS